MDAAQRNAAMQEAAALAAESRFREAGVLLLGRLGVSPQEAGGLDPNGRKIAYMAATYLVKAGEVAAPVEIFIALGDLNKAADVLEKNGDIMGAQKVREGKVQSHQSLRDTEARRTAVGGGAVNAQAAQRLEQDGKLDVAVKMYVQLKRFGDAGRLLRQLGRTADAAEMFAEGGMAYEAAVCYVELGDTGKGLDNLIRVPRTDRRYRLAAQHAVRLAGKLNVLNFQMDNFLSEFIKTGPVDEQELDTFYRLLTLYEQHNLLENVKEILRKILAKDPGFRDSAARLESLERFTQSSSAVYQKIRDQEAGYRGERKGSETQGPRAAPGLPPIPKLPDLPPIPSLPGVPGAPTQYGVAPGVLPPGAVPPGTVYQQQYPAQPYPVQPVQPTMYQPYGVAPPGATVQQPYAPPPPPTGAPQPMAPEEAFAIGTTIVSRYRLDAKLGQGGMAMVFKAADLELDEVIALKVFLQQVLDPKAQEESLARFKQELKLSRQLNHKNIIRLYDIGMHQGYRYISMELLVGGDLDSRLERPLEFAEGLGYLVQACAGLQAAHDMGVVHRDIKPDNLFITVDEVVKVMDFGIAKNVHTPGLTVEGITAGTPQYMAPEQISSFSKVTPSADLYSLGLVAYKMFTKKLPFDHDELAKLLMMHLTEKPRPPRELNPDIPEDLDQLIMRCLAKDPSQRPANAREFAKEIQRIRARFRREP